MGQFIYLPNLREWYIFSSRCARRCVAVQKTHTCEEQSQPHILCNDYLIMFAVQIVTNEKKEQRTQAGLIPSSNAMHKDQRTIVCHRQVTIAHTLMAYMHESLAAS